MSPPAVLSKDKSSLLQTRWLHARQYWLLMSSCRWLEHVDNIAGLFCCKAKTTVLITACGILLIAECVMALLTAAAWKIGLWNCSDCKEAAQNSVPVRNPLDYTNNLISDHSGNHSGVIFPQTVGQRTTNQTAVQPNLGIKMRLCLYRFTVLW